MEQWPLHSNVIDYAQYNRYAIDDYKLNIRLLEPKFTKEYVTS